MTFTPGKARSAAVASGLLLAAAFPPLNWWPLALVALVPLLLAVWSKAACRSKAVPALIHRFNDAPEPNAARSGGESALAEEAEHSVDPCGQNVRPPYPGAVSPDCGDAAAGGLETQGLEGLATAAAEETHRRGACAPVFWPALRLGWLFGFVFFTTTLWWIKHVTLPGMLALTCYLALYPAVAMGIAGWLGMRRDERWGAALGKSLLLAGVWTGLEWVRSVALSGFPWNGLAVPLFPLLGLADLASTLGVIGLSGIVVCFTISLAAIVRLKQGPALFMCYALPVIAALVFAVLELNGAIHASLMHKKALPDDSEFLSAILVQPNVTMEEKLSPDSEVQRQRYFGLVDQTNQALAAAAGSAGRIRPNLIVWPESAVPGFFNDMVQGGAFSDQLQQGDFSLVTGADHEEWGKLYNSIAVMRGSTENRAIHPKIQLVPFGEFIPFRKEVPLFEKLLGHLIPMDFNAGTSLEPMRVHSQPFSIVPLVCFEDTIGGHARKFIRAEPQVIVNVTNDNWFRQSPATEMHFANARWRALELRRALVRSANTGVTAIVSPWGQVQRIPSHQKGMVTGKFYPGTGTITFYATHGDLFSKVAGGLGFFGCGAVWCHRCRRRKFPDNN